MIRKSFFNKFRKKRSTRSSPRSVQPIQFPSHIEGFIHDRKLRRDQIKNVNPSNMYGYGTNFHVIELSNGDIWEVAPNEKIAKEIAIEKMIRNFIDNPSKYDEDFLLNHIFDDDYFGLIEEEQRDGLVEQWNNMGWRDREEFLHSEGLESSIDMMLRQDGNLGIMLDGSPSVEYYQMKVMENYDFRDDSDYLEDREQFMRGDKQRNELFANKYNTPESLFKVASSYVNIFGMNETLSNHIMYADSNNAIYWKPSQE